MDIPKPTIQSIKKQQMNTYAVAIPPKKIKLSLISTKERDEYRVPVYDYIL